MAVQPDADSGRRILEIIEVVIHSTLYLRQVYPSELFVRRKKYDVPVFQCASATINEYISGIIKEVAKELTRIEKISLILLDGETPVERYCFIIDAPDTDTDVEKDWESPENMTRHLRSILVKLNSIDCALSPAILSDTRSFSVVLETKAKSNEEQDAGESRSQKSSRPGVSESKRWTPLPLQKAVELGETEESFHVNAINIGRFKLGLQVAEIQN